MLGKFKFVLVGMLVLLIMVGVLSLANQEDAESRVVPTEIVPQNITESNEATDELEPTKEKDIRP